MERKWMVQARKEKGIKGSELAKELRVGRSYITEIEKGRKTPGGVLALDQLR